MTSCPYCNTELPADLANSSRITCPRCGESFSNKSQALTPPDPPRVGGGWGGSERPARAGVRRNRRFALIVLAGMVLLAAGAAVFMLKTRSQRGLRPLAEHPALGYLPDDTDAILNVNLSMAEKTPEGREMIERLGLGAGGNLNLEGWTGLNLDQIEDVMVGFKLAGQVLLPGIRLPGIRIVVQTKSGYDADELRKRLGTKRSKKEGERSYDVVQPPGLPFEFALWCCTAKTFVLCYPVEDFARIPAEPNPHVERFAPPIADLLRYRSDRDDFLSAVAHADDWNKTPLALLNLKKEDRETLFQVHTLGIGLRMDKGTITSRSRPARITEEVKPGPKGVALDLVVMTAGGTDMPAVRESVEKWIDRQKLETRDSRLNENLYSVSVIGTPEEWERALKSLKTSLAKSK